MILSVLSLTTMIQTCRTENKVKSSLFKPKPRQIEKLTIALSHSFGFSKVKNWSNLKTNKQTNVGKLKYMNRETKGN